MNAPQLVVNWERIMDDIRRAGITSYSLEREVAIPRTTLIGYASLGARPKYDEGERLLRYWLNLTNSARDQIPYLQERINGHQLRR